jgi:aryl-alcohol dehydrogenase (NADP+)
MDYVRFGRTGMHVSRLALGCMTYGSSRWRPWVLDEAEAIPFYHRALDLGINFFDTADMYSLGESERVTGRALAGIRRDELVIATKVYHPMGSAPNQRGLSRKHILESIDASLTRLHMDYVDLYQIHRWDAHTPIEETLEALNDVVRAGKALYIGASSMYAWQFAQAVCISRARGWAPFVSMQNHYNLIYREEEREMIPFCGAEGIAVIPWSPLARGFLAGNRTRERGGETSRAATDDFAHRLYYGDDDFAVLEAVLTLAAQRGVQPAQIALAWMLHKPAITAPIIGASRMHHLEEAVAALAIVLSEDEIAALEAAYRPHPVLGM